MVTKPASERRTVSVAEVGAALGLHPNTVYLAIARGDVPAVKLGRQYLIPRNWLEALLVLSAPRRSEPVASAEAPPD